LFQGISGRGEKGSGTPVIDGGGWLSTLSGEKKKRRFKGGSFLSVKGDQKGEESRGPFYSRGGGTLLPWDEVILVVENGSVSPKTIKSIADGGQVFTRGKKEKGLCARRERRDSAVTCSLLKKRRKGKGGKPGERTREGEWQ